MKIQSLLIGTLCIATLHAQEKPADPFRETKADPSDNSEGSAPKNVSICYETFSLPLAMAAKLQREQLPDSELYTRILAAVEKQTARQETFTVIRGKSGNKASAESISEQMYPTEFEPPELPSMIGVSVLPSDPKTVPSSPQDLEKLKGAADINSFEGVKTPATPTAFDTRNVGVTCEIEAILGETDKYMDLRIAPAHVALVGQSIAGQGLAKTEMPVFENQSLSTAAVLQINQPFLLGTINRPPVSKADPDSANRVWFAFVTGTIAKP